MEKLTQRRQQLIRLLSSGLVVKEAASKMGISHSGAKTLLNRAQHQLGYRTSFEMMWNLGRQIENREWSRL